MIAFVVSLFFAYLVGSIPTSFIFGKLLKKVDITKHGSGNAGATNVFRVVGKIPAVIVLALDIFKGIFSVAFLPYIFFNNYIGITMGFGVYKILLGAAVITGHVWSVFLKGKGGKGVATTAGVLMVLAPKVFTASLGVWLITFSLFRVISVASVTASVFLPIAAILFRLPMHNVLFFVFLCILSTYKHKANIRRLLRGEEKRLF
ncbi:MAG: glycerol-3-phosphate 1-O-acyltransferase PlsY [Omnitrophica bacterium]|nr:glycerol-3-phosphate 1-O-acyltransferase PlsY [Candidatus Omnitrophota bacterium]